MVSARLYKFAKKVEIINSERKYEDNELTSVSVSSGGQIVSIGQNINPGTGRQQRIGEKISPSSLMFRYEVAVSDSTNLLRVVIFQWLPNSISFSNINQVLDTSVYSGTISAGYDVFAPYAKHNQGQFKVLYDRVHTLVLNTYKAHEYVQLELKGLRPIQYSTNLVGNNEGENMIFMILISDSTAANHPTIRGIFRLNYYDV